LLAPVVFFALMSPLQMVLWFRAGEYCLVAFVLLLWTCALWRASAIAKQQTVSTTGVAQR
jgi:hypothetical protein